MDANAHSRLTRKLVSEASAKTEALIRRGSTQLEFARTFDQATGNRHQEAVERAEKIFGETPQDLQAWLGQLEEALAELGKEAKAYTIHCVGHGHIDMNWMWSWPETVATTHDTFASVLSFMEQYPGFTYSQSQASVYALVEKHYPEMFEQIQRRVRERVWEVAAAHWVEGDKNISSGESLAHHLLYTRNYFKEKFGLSPEDVPIDWEPDTFGHANTIPGILRQGGVKYYYCCRPGGGYGHVRTGEERPPVFWWQGLDGSRVLVNRETTWYNSYVNIGTNIALPMAAFAAKTGLHDWLNVYGVGNHGGGPTRAEIEWYLELGTYPVYPQVEFSTVRRYFEAVEQEIASSQIELPVLDHELNFEFTGCYTSQSAIKRANRFGENFCVEAEVLGAIGERAFNIPHPKEQLRSAWINVLFNQFHDILPGSGVAATREHAMGLFQEVGAITGSVKRNVTNAIAKRIDTAGLLPDSPEGSEEREAMQSGRANTPFEGGSGLGSGMTGFSQARGGGRRFFPVVVYNPCAWERSEMVEAHLYDIDVDPSRLVVRDESGAQYSTLTTYHGSHWAHDWGHRKTSILFPAINVPPLGYKTFLVCEGAATGNAPTIEVLNDLLYETERLSVGFDRFSPAVASLVDKRTGHDLAEGFLGFGSWDFVLEQPRGMTSWTVGGEAERHSLRAHTYSVKGPSRNEGTGAPTASSSAALIVQDLRVPGTESTVRVRALVHGLEPRIDFEADIDWREIGTPEQGIPSLVLTFDSSLGQSGEPTRAVFETPFGHVERPTLEEDVPTLRYAHLGNGGGFTILQDSKYGFRRSETGLEMRIVRSSFDPDHAPEVGKSKLRYSVYLHDKPPTPAELTRLGASFNHPLIVFPALMQNGDLPVSASYAEVENENVMLTTMKLAEDGKGLILRLVELNGVATEAIVKLNKELHGGLSEATTVDLMELPFAGEATLSGDTLRVRLQPYSFATVRLS